MGGCEDSQLRQYPGEFLSQCEILLVGGGHQRQLDIY